MKVVLGACLVLALIMGTHCDLRRKRQQGFPPIATGEVLTSVFQIPIQTLNAVHDLLQATRTRGQAIYQAYQQIQQQHPNHRPNPHFVYDRKRASPEKFYNSKALVQP